MKQIINLILLTLISTCQPAFAQTKVDGSQLKGDVLGGTASNTRRLVLPKDTKANLDGLTRKQGTIVYDTTTNKPYYDDGTNLKVIGSGSGGSVNLITDGDAEGANPFTAYKDAGAASPVDGTSGSPAFVSIATSSTDPLTGDKSFLITKSFGNPIGEGVSVPFTVQPAYKARMLKISFDYFASTGFEPPATFNSDITVWIYDVTAGKLIQPSNFQITSRDTNGTFQADFQSDSASTSYRLILHCGTVNTQAWTFKADNFSVAPSQYVYAATVTDLISYGTLTIGATTTAPTKGSIGTDIIRMARVGDHARIQGVYYQNALGSAAAGSGDYLFTLPGGVSFDSTKVKFEATLGGINSWGNGTQLGSASASNGVAATDQGVGVILPYDATRFRIGILYTNGSTTTKGVIGAGYFNLVHATRSISFDFQAPIQGWTSNQQISDRYDARDLRVNVLRSTNLTGLNPNNTSIKIPIAPTTIEDTYSGWDSTNNRVTIKTAKDYDISYGAWIESTNVATGAYYIIQLMKNGVEIDSSHMQYTSIANQFMRLPGGRTGITAVAGDYFEVFIYSSANHSASTLTARRVWLDVKANQSSTTMSRGAKLVAKYSYPAATAITANTVMNWSSKIEDTHNAVTVGASWKFTAPYASWYEITAQNNNSGAAFLRVWKGGVAGDYLGGGTANTMVSGFTRMWLNAGEYIDVRPDSSTTTQSITLIHIKSVD